MMTKKNVTSTISFKSNLYKVSERSIKQDEKFLNQLHDPFALEVLKNYINKSALGRFQLSERQQDEFDHASGHCALAEEGDYPWGTKLIGDKYEVVCLCENIDCKEIKRCRKNLTDADIEKIKKSKEKNSGFSDTENMWSEEVNILDNQKENKDIEKYPENDGVENSEIEEVLESENNVNIEDDNFESKEFNTETKTVDVKEPNIEANTDSKEETSESILDSFKPLIGTAAFDVLPEDLKEKIMSAIEAESCDDGRDRAVKEADTIVENEVLLCHGWDFKVACQKDVIEASNYSRIVVNAGPGTGKTHTLIERIKYLLNQGMNPENMVVLCFSRNAVAVIKERLIQAANNKEIPENWHGIEVRTFDSFATKLIMTVQEMFDGKYLPDNYKISCDNYEERIVRATELVNKIDGILDGCQYFMVDEIQDLVAYRADFVITMIKALSHDCGILALGDSCQSIYDYQVRNLKENGAIDVTDSLNFYNRLFQPDINFERYSIVTNYRQNAYFESFMKPYRNAILHDDETKCKQELKLISEKIKLSKEKWKAFGKINEETGILTRNNAQALRISTELNRYGIFHNYKGKTGNNNKDSWIANVLYSYSGNHIDEKNFVTQVKNVYGENIDNQRIKEAWNSIKSIVGDTGVNKVKIETFIKNLFIDDSYPIFFEELDIKRNPILYVSTIHKAKGSEFENVLIEESLFSGEINENELEENRVRYVAITRGKKALSGFKIKKDNEYLSISKISGRVYKKIPGRKYISFIEVGRPGDIKNTSFALSKEQQEYIRNNVSRGDELIFVKCEKSDTSKSIKSENTYSVRRAIDPDFIIGYTGSEFFEAMNEVLKAVFKRIPSYKYFPDKLKGIYVTGFNTCIKPVYEELPGARKYGDMYIWEGISISGLAQVVARGY